MYRGEADVLFSGEGALLEARFSACSGLGVIAGGSLPDPFLKLVTESIDDRLELLACPPPRLIMEAVLDLRLVTSDTSDGFGPPRIAMAELPALCEFPLLRAGRT